LDRIELRGIIEEIIVPLFTGSKILADDFPSNKSESKVALLDGSRCIRIKVDKADDYRVGIFREQPFSNDDKSIISAIIEEFSGYQDIPNKYKKEILVLYVENAIAKFLSGKNEDSDTIIQIIRELRKWAGRMYEGRDVSFGIELIASENELEVKENILDSLDQDFFALLSDGIDSFIKIDKSGSLLGIEQCAKCQGEIPKVPYRFMNFAKSILPDSIGFVLLKNKEILIIKNRELMFAYRRGAWRYFNPDTIIQKIADKSRYTIKEVREAIYSTCLDVSFSRTGGSITYLRKSKEKKCIEYVLLQSDIACSKECLKAKTVYCATDNKQFNEIPRKIRQELVGIDGATIIRADGTVLTCGAIVKIEPGSTGGGRLASVQTLSEYGVAIKISADGAISCYSSTDETTSENTENKQNDTKKTESKLLFSIG